MKLLIAFGICAYIALELLMKQYIPLALKEQDLRMALVLVLCAVYFLTDAVRQRKAAKAAQVAQLAAAAAKPVVQIKEVQVPAPGLKEAEAKIAELTKQVTKLKEENFLTDEALKAARELINDYQNKEMAAGGNAAQLAALGMLNMMQDKGRLIDFVMGDISKVSDAQMGAAARVVHQGLSEFLCQCFDFKKVHDGKEGDQVSLKTDYLDQGYRLLGKVPAKAPYNGKVLHCGWQVIAMSVPQAEIQRSSEGIIISPAQVECK